MTNLNKKKQEDLFLFKTVCSMHWAHASVDFTLSILLRSQIQGGSPSWWRVGIGGDLCFT